MPSPKPKKNKYGNGHPSDGGGSVTDPAGTDFTLPPFMSYDPSINAEIRANDRGLQDINQDFQTQRKIDRQDYRQTRTDIKQGFKRSTQDIKTSANQTRRGFKEKTADIHQTAQRGREDFRLQLNDMFRKFGIQTSNQAQAANARGVGDGGTLAAAAAKRESNMARDRGSLELARSRQQEDIATALQRLSKDQGEFRRDLSRTRGRLGEDTARESKLAGRDFSRTRRSARRENNRANREGYFSELDLTQAAIYAARQNNPGAFSKYGSKGGDSDKPKKKKKGK